MLRWNIVGLLAVVWALPALALAGGQEDAKVSKLIVQLLEDKDVKHRRLALFELEIVGKRVKGVLQAITMALEKDTEAIVRREAALALSRWGEDAKDAIPAIAHSLKIDKDDEVREVAARALLGLVPHSKTALAQLVSALEDKYAPTRAAAAETIKALGASSKTAVPKLIDYLKAGKDKKTDAAARMHVALALGRIGAEGATGTAVLLVILADTDEDVTVREAAAESLGRFGLDATGAAKPLADILKENKNPQSLRLAAVKALAKLEGETKQIWPALKVGMSDGDSAIRLLTIRATGPYAKEEPEAIKGLAKLARDDDNVEVRLAAIQELGLLGPAAKAAEPDLRYIIEHDEREAVRQEAETALKKIQG